MHPAPYLDPQIELLSNEARSAWLARHLRAVGMRPIKASLPLEPRAPLPLLIDLAGLDGATMAQLLRTCLKGFDRPLVYLQRPDQPLRRFGDAIMVSSETELAGLPSRLALRRRRRLVERERALRGETHREVASGNSQMDRGERPSPPGDMPQTCEPDFFRRHVAKQARDCHHDEAALSLLHIRLRGDSHADGNDAEMARACATILPQLRQTDLTCRIAPASLLISLRDTTYAGGIRLVQRISDSCAGLDAPQLPELACRLTERRANQAIDAFIEAAMSGPHAWRIAA